jgi:hypothetical protein
MSDLQRLEDKVDRLTDAVTKLIILEERQNAQAVRLDSLERNEEKLYLSLLETDKKVDKWVNRGFGAWAIMLMLFTFVELYVKTT